MISITNNEIGIYGKRWTSLMRQLGGLAKVDQVGFYAAICSLVFAVAETSSGVLPSKVECGRLLDQIEEIVQSTSLSY